VREGYELTKVLVVFSAMLGGAQRCEDGVARTWARLEPYVYPNDLEAYHTAHKRDTRWASIRSGS
jgi:hypothetical protein